ncbi:hypothetical protein PPYR_07454 [Photinus pyralis]|uniref:Transforming growth factor beta regulator 1 n=1 Tax=Photinus pyralis TaxID=7054 RepID=A0A1Y1LNW5_PHOPY|nr:transforming growth factor beta regulator 1 [Photinus pyralis]KAB0799574.1 hypothetical protein PPYR_07454 [Photinus pyralis]
MNYSYSNKSSLTHTKITKPPGKYKTKLMMLKNTIRETVFENLALCDEVSEVQELILIRNEEKKFLLRKLCQIDPQVDIEVQRIINTNTTQTPLSTSTTPPKKPKKRSNNDDHKGSKRKLTSKTQKKLLQLIPLDQTGHPIYPIVLDNLSIHSIGEIVCDRPEFHSEEAIFPVDYISTRIYGSMKDPTSKCVYTCKISSMNDSPRFELTPDDDPTATIIGSSADMCHSLLLQQINDTLSLNVVSVRPRGNDFFGLTHPTVLNLIQSSPAAKKCTNYRWSKFEVSKSGECYVEDPDTCLSFESLQNSINYCKFKMTSEIHPQPSTSILQSKESFGSYYV